MTAKNRPLPEWDRVLSAASRLQQMVPDAVLVGGRAVALHTKHRQSEDADHGITNLRDQFDAILADLEQVSGWKTARTRRPVLILGSLDGIMTGVRQLIREAPLETTETELAPGGPMIVFPTAAELLRIKCKLVLDRNATRDFVDIAALTDTLGEDAAVEALATFDDLYTSANGESPSQQLVKQLGYPRPFDLKETELEQYKGLKAPLTTWTEVARINKSLSTALFSRLQVVRRSPSSRRDDMGDFM